MSDSSKAEKIAAARKKLKQFQSKTKADNTVPSGTVNTSCGTTEPVTVNTNGNVGIDCNTVDAAQVQQLSMHFGAIDPVPFDSAKLFDQNVPADNMFSYSEVALNTTAPPNINVNMMPAPSQAIPTPQQPVVTETFPQFSTLNQPPQNPNTNQIREPQSNEAAANDLAAQSDQRNQELTNLLQVEKVRNHELSVKVTQQHSTIEELSRELQQLRQNGGTILDLQQQMNAHVQTVNILVGEKSDLTAKLQQKDQRLNEFESESVELKGRLNASRHRVAELEKDLNTLTQSHQKYDGSQQALCSELETLQEDNKRLKRLHQESCDENNEIQHQLALKLKEIDELKNVITAKCSELEMASVRLEQLTGGQLSKSDGLPNIDQTQQEQRILDTERQMIELQNMISELTNDRDRTQQQYQTYVQHLSGETETMKQRIQELTKTNEKLTKREESLVHHVQELEKQIQKQLSTQRRLAALRDDEKPASDETHKDGNQSEASSVNEDVVALKDKLNAIAKEKADLNALLEDRDTQTLALQQQLLEKDSKLCEIESELERLRTERPDTTNLLATIESDKVAASRAMTQNQELRKQLEEMQQAYVQVSNDKLELASQLQSEEYMNRDVRNRFSEIETELKTVKEKLHFKDEEMIRLTHENSQFDAKIQELTKKLDSSKVDELQKKLHSAHKEIKRLQVKLQAPADGESVENSEVSVAVAEVAAEHVHVHDGEHKHDHDHDHCSHDHSENGHDETRSAVEAFENSDVVSVTSTINIATNEAMDKLQERFKRTMTEIADLTEEKHRLEHLVTQLQSETETIGEYIALYQTQRRLLKQREIEKDVQLHRIAADREDMKDKLRQLNELVELLLVQKGFSNAKEIMAQLNSTNNNSENVSVNGSSTDAVPSEIVELPIASNGNDTEHKHLSTPDAISESSHHDPNTRETATKIINLLTDIKDKNLHQDYSVVPNSVDHCSCCSGKLEVV